MRALVIPVEGPVREVQVPQESGLGVLQELVGGYIEALPLPEFVNPDGRATAYVHAEGKFEGAGPNMRATDFMVPGIGLFMGDHIAGPMVLMGFDPEVGVNEDVPDAVVRRVRLIEREAA